MFSSEELGGDSSEGSLFGILSLDTEHGLLTPGSVQPDPRELTDRHTGAWRPHNQLTVCTFPFPVVLQTSSGGHEGISRCQNRNNNVHTLSLEG